MVTRAISLRIPEETRSAIDEIAKHMQRDFSSVANEMVYKIAIMYRANGDDVARLRAGYDRPSQPQLRAALACAEAYPEEIERRIALDASVSPEWLEAQYPYMRPRAGLTPQGHVAERA
jgi:hypothetical protein